jgi:DNA invertase Pin-like site-specific DNA recombinase
MSTDRQEASIPEQKAWAQRAARTHGVEIVATFQDDGVAGSEIERRQGLTELLGYCESRAAKDPVTAVVVWDADRLSRADSFRTAGVINRLMDSGCTRLLTQEGWIDFDCDLDRLLWNIKQDMSRAAYSKSLSKNVTRAALSRARQGKWVSGKAPHGYAIVGEKYDKRLVPGDPAHVATVRELFRLYAGTAASLGDVAHKLNAAGMAGPRGRWSRSMIREVLLNGAYLGELIWNCDSRAKYHRVHAGEVATVPRGARRNRTVRPNAKADRVVIKDAHPALIDPETFAAAGRKLTAHRSKGHGGTTPFPGGGEWILSGLLHCGDCGGRMVGHKERKHGRHGEVWTYQRYCCAANTRHGRGSCFTNRVRQDDVLRAVADLIHESFCTPTRLKKLRAECGKLAKEQAKDDGRERQRLRDRVADLDRRIDQGTERLLLVPADQVDKAAGKLRQWRDERDGVARELSRLESAAENGKQFMGRVTAALDALKQLEGSIAEAPAESARDLLAGLVGKVTLRFDHSRPLKRGRRTELEGVEVELVPEMSHLLGTGRNIRLEIGGSRS